MNDITQFSMADLTKRIVEQTQAQFSELIPKEMFEGLIEESVKAFNQSVGALAAVISTQQVYTTLNTALNVVGIQVKTAMETQHIPHEFGVNVAACVPGGEV